MHLSSFSPLLVCLGAPADYLLLEQRGGSLARQSIRSSTDTLFVGMLRKNTHDMKIFCEMSLDQHPRCSRARQEAPRSLPDHVELITIYARLDIGSTPWPPRPQALCLLSQPLFVLRMCLLANGARRF